MYYIYKTTTFESAHLLDGHPQCGKLHGHSYKAEVFIQCEAIDTNFGFVIDFHEISDYFKRFDHSSIVIKISAEQIAENACRFFEERLNAIYPSAEHHTKVRIWETRTGYAEFEI